MITQPESLKQNEKLKSILASTINTLNSRLADLKKAKIRRDDFVSLKNELKETGKLNKGLKEADYPFLKAELDQIQALTEEVHEEDFSLLEDWEKSRDSLKKETENLLYLLQKDIANLKEIVGRLAMKSFLIEEIQEIGTKLGGLRGKIKDEDFNSLQAELDERSETLATSNIFDNSQLFVIRRETGMLKENVEAMSVKKRWWSGIPISAWLALLALVIIAYFGWLAILQWRGGSQGLIYDYPATQTATAMQAEAISAATATPSPTPAAIP